MLRVHSAAVLKLWEQNDVAQLQLQVSKKDKALSYVVSQE